MTRAPATRRTRTRATRDEGGPSSSLWTVAVQLLAATAGLTAFVAFIGAAMLWIRFNALDLPADRAVALLPRSDLLTVGAHSLAFPILIGLAAVFVVFLIGPAHDRGEPTLGLWIAVGVLFAVGLLVLLLSVSSYDVFFEQIAAYGGLLFATALIVLTATRTKGFGPLAWVVFASVALFAGVLAIVRTSGTPKLEPAAVVLTGQEMRGTSGFLIAETDDDVYLAPLPGSGDLADPFADSDLDRVVEIPGPRSSASPSVPQPESPPTPPAASRHRACSRTSASSSPPRPRLPRRR